MAERPSNFIQQKAEETFASQGPVDRIVQKDRDIFYDALSRIQIGKMEFPDAALRYFIPKRILELADDPSLVNICRLPSDKYFSFIIIERKNEPISNKVDFERFVERFWKSAHMFTAKERKKPSSVDDVHATHYYWIESGVLSLRDYVWMHIRLERKSSQNIYVDTHWDRQEHRRQGVGHSFYNRLREILKVLGYRYITGQNTSDNITFFTDPIKGLARTPLSKIKIPKRQIFFDIPQDISGSDLRKKTIDFLYPEDKKLFESNHSRKQSI